MKTSYQQRYKTRSPLFTMGSPLRQLYGLRFPHLYQWARTDDPNHAKNSSDPTLLNLVRWMNHYRSGDYVGRLLWRTEQQVGVWKNDQSFAFGRRYEECIGAGAHTHYWDRTAPEVRTVLDVLITSG